MKRSKVTNNLPGRKVSKGQLAAQVKTKVRRTEPESKPSTVTLENRLASGSQANSNVPRQLLQGSNYMKVAKRVKQVDPVKAMAASAPSLEILKNMRTLDHATGGLLVTRQPDDVSRGPARQDFGVRVALVGAIGNEVPTTIDDKGNIRVGRMAQSPPKNSIIIPTATLESEDADQLALLSKESHPANEQSRERASNQNQAYCQMLQDAALFENDFDRARSDE